MNLRIQLGEMKDIDELEKLYDDLNDFLAEGINYPGWKKGIYPTRQDAIHGIEEGKLYVARCDGAIAGTIILTHRPEEAYHQAKWAFDSDYSDVIVIHTFAVHPDYMKVGIGKALMDFAEQESRKQGMRAIRLDVYENNIPAIKLYEKSGYQYVDTVDLGLSEYGLDWFKLYELVLIVE
ncbi:MAG TPA: GNAT family N-acetyltransferase [Lachnospiraceae bacterium]|nr:GNAT family N-acetyltransferase [Lachnospiraceae bacterium]